jgi:hypothetical protein
MKTDILKHEDLVFGTEVFVSHKLYKISAEKLDELRATYGRCLSKNQILREEDNDTSIELELDDLDIIAEYIIPCTIVGYNETFRQYKVVAHKKFNLSNVGCYLHSGPNYSQKTLELSVPGKDFEDYFMDGGYIIESLNTDVIYKDGFYKCQKEEL